MTMLISYQMLIQKQLTYECDVPLTMFPIIIIWGPTFVKKRAKKVLAERSADFPPNMMIAISSIFGLTLFLTQISMTSPWYEHFSNSFQSYHQWWSINLSLVNKNFPRSQFYLNRFFHSTFLHCCATFATLS